MPFAFWGIYDLDDRGDIAPLNYLYYFTYFCCRFLLKIKIKNEFFKNSITILN